MLRTVVCLIGLSILGCNRPNWDTPENAYRSFARAVEKNELKVAYGTLSTATRNELAARAKDIAAAAGGSVKDDPAALFFASNARLPAPTRIEVVRTVGEQATLAVYTSDKEPPQTVEMVKEPEGWRLHLLRAPPDAGS